MAESPEDLGKGPKPSVKRKQADLVAAWERFLEDECGVMPGSIASVYLRMTPQGVHAAAQRGWLKWFPIGRVRYYSRKDCIRYRWHVSRKFEDNRPQPQICPADPDLDARLTRYLAKSKVVPPVGRDVESGSPSSSGESP